MLVRVSCGVGAFCIHLAWSVLAEEGDFRRASRAARHPEDDWVGCRSRPGFEKPKEVLKLEKEIKKVVSFIETHSIRGEIAGKDQIGAEERTFFDNAPSVSLM